MLVIYDGKEWFEVVLDLDVEDLEDLLEELVDEFVGVYVYKFIGVSFVDVCMIDFVYIICRLYGEDIVVYEG